MLPKVEPTESCRGWEEPYTQAARLFPIGNHLRSEGIYACKELKCTGADVDSINFPGHVTCRINLHTQLGKANSNYHLEMICDWFFVCFLCALAPMGF